MKKEIERGSIVLRAREKKKKGEKNKREEFATARIDGSRGGGRDGKIVGKIEDKKKKEGKRRRKEKSYLFGIRGRFVDSPSYLLSLALTR